MKILVTGAAGFIGSSILKHLESLGGYELLGVDYFDKGFSPPNSFSFGSFRNVSDLETPILAIDIKEESFVRILIDYRPDVIIHLAADSNTLSSDQYSVLVNNVEPFRKILAYCSKTHSRLVYASSASVYGSTDQHHILTENISPINPSTVHAYSKYQMEILARHLPNSAGLRFFTVYGERESAKGSTASVAYQIINSYFNGKVFPLFSDSASTYRDFIYISDVVLACTKLIDNGSGIYNMSTGISHSYLELYQILSTLITDLPEPQFIPNNVGPSYQHYTRGSIDRLKELLGAHWYPTPIEVGLSQLLENWK